MREAEPGDHVGLTARLARIEPAWQALAGHDLLAVEAGPGCRGQPAAAHPAHRDAARSAAGRVLQELRGRLARQTGGLGEAILALHRQVEQAAGNAAAVSELELWQANLEEARAALRAAPKRPGRPRKYSRANLEQVARLYSEAVRPAGLCGQRRLSNAEAGLTRHRRQADQGVPPTRGRPPRCNGAAQSRGHQAAELAGRRPQQRGREDKSAMRGSIRHRGEERAAAGSTSSTSARPRPSGARAAVDDSGSSAGRVSLARGAAAE